MSNLTIKDIAMKSGVSKSTVSRVLNNSNSVKEETRDKVLSVIKEENYFPSAVARSLSKQMTDSIGVVVPQLENPFFSEIISGITEVLDSHNLAMICCSTSDDIEKDFNALGMLKNHRVRGLIYTPASDYSRPEDRQYLTNLLKEINTPVVLMDRQLPGMNFDGVFFDDCNAMYLSTKKLLEAGHRKIGIINAPLEKWSLARIRHKGYAKAFDEFGLEIDNRYVFAGNYRMKMAYELTRQMLEMKDRPTAVLTCNNATSMGFLKALYERGETLEDITCVGLDKLDMLDIVGIDFNYIERNPYKMGKRAMELLISRIAFPERPRQEIMMESPVVIKKIR